VRGPLVMDGYRDSPELTAEAFKGDWLHTGDVAVRDPGGFLRIVDRTKDMIVTGGFNVYPREIEDIIGQHAAVSQVAVIGVPHVKWGEAVKALVVLRAGQTVDDGTITANIKTALLKAPDVKGTAIDVDTVIGTVTLKGAVENQDQADRAVQIAKGTEGVKSVVNQLTVKGK